MPFAELPTGAKLEYVDTQPDGDRTVVIALHGMLGTGRTHLGHVIDWLDEKGYRVIAPTLRGYGESTPKPRDFPMDFYQRDARDVLAFMDALSIEKAHIIGYSDGGEISLICAGTQPDRFLSAAAWGAVGYFAPEMRPVAQRMIPGSAWLTEAEMQLHGIPDADAFAVGWVRAITHMIDAGGDVSISLAHKITCPLLLMLGKDDTLNPAWFAERFLEKVANGRLQLFDCGHAVHDEQTEAFRAALGKHLGA